MQTNIVLSLTTALMFCCQYCLLPYPECGYIFCKTSYGRLWGEKPFKKDRQRDRQRHRAAVPKLHGILAGLEGSEHCPCSTALLPV